MTTLDDRPLAAPLPAQPVVDRSNRRSTRIERAKLPVAVDVLEAAAVANEVCIKPVAMRVMDQITGEVEYVDVPCGATLASKCPSCATKARRLRMHQCREGWHLDADPDLTADAPNDEQLGLVSDRAGLTVARDIALSSGTRAEVSELDDAVTQKDAQLRKAGVRGDIDPPKAPRVHRSTRRRDDVPDLPRKQMSPTTIGKIFTAPDGTVFRPSMFLTVTLPSYGKVNPDGTPRDHTTYDYQRAARDAILFTKLFDRLIGNLRRFAGFNVQYFATVEPQKRLAPHAHIAIRGTIERKVIRQVVAATYRQIWWPTPGQAVHDETDRPLWDEHTGGFVDPATGVPLTTWAQAMAAMKAADQLAAEHGDREGAAPFHVLRLGTQLDVQGLLAGSPDSERRVRYLAKYLTKSMSDAHVIDATDPNAARQRAHLDRMVEQLRVEPCGEDCANWLRYGIQPRRTRRTMAPGSCRSKAHKREHLGHAGRRIQVSQKWSGKTLADHRADRRAWVLASLGVDPNDQAATDHGGRGADKTRDRFTWQRAAPDAPIQSRSHRLLRAINESQQRRAQREAARDGKPPPGSNLSATDLAGSDDVEVA